MSIVLGIDPGFANIGIAVADLHTLQPISLRHFSTEKSNKKLNVLATDDNFRRSQEIHLYLRALIVEWSPALICAESMSFPRNASAAAKMAYAWGVLASIASDCKIPVLLVTPQAIKKNLTGKIKADKPEIAAALEAKYGNALLDKVGIADIKKADREHPLDALGAIVTASNTSQFLLAYNLSSANKDLPNGG